MYPTRRLRELQELAADGQAGRRVSHSVAFLHHVYMLKMRSVVVVRWIDWVLGHLTVKRYCIPSVGVPLKSSGNRATGRV